MDETSKVATEVYDFRNEPINYVAEIRQMMHGFGDCNEPLIESAKIIEEVVLRQMRTIVNKACEIADNRGSSLVTTDDFFFLLRKDHLKIQRLKKYLELKDLKTSLNKVLVSGKDSDVEFVQSRKKKPHEAFLDLIDNTGDLLAERGNADQVKKNRYVRYDLITRKMDEACYLEFCKARSVSFVNKNRHKFSDWICPEGDVNISKHGILILGYLAYETVAQIIDLSFLVREDQNKIHGDSIDRLTLSYTNPYTYKPYQYGNKGNVTKPITPAEIHEALRRYWSPQLEMTGPFHRWAVKKPHCKLLSC